MDTEVNLAAEIVTWLRADGWTVYQEVEVHTGSARADIVAVRDGIVYVVECKLSLSLDLLAQANGWLYYAHQVSVAVPRFRKGSRAQDFAREVIAVFGFGMLTVYLDSLQETVRENVKPQRRSAPHSADVLIASLQPEHETYAKAGNANGARWTAYKSSLAQVERLRAERSALTVRAVVAELGKLHWSSEAGARRGLAAAIKRGHLQGFS